MTLEGDRQDVDEHWMRRALEEASAAATRGEVPVGAVAVMGDTLIAAAGNAVERELDPTQHAEMRVLRAACQQRKGWRLDGMTLYVTLEPCPMCAGAILLARMDRCVWGAPDPKKGADGSVYDVLSSQGGNHRIEVTSNVLPEESAGLLRSFFAQRRH